MIKLGIIGTSKLVHHFFYLDKNKFIIKGISGRNESKLEVFSKKLNCKYYLDYDELINQQDIDLIYINLPDYLHFEYVHKSLKSNKHVVCEKSFGIKESDIINLVNLANSKKKYLFESFMYFYHKQYDHLKTLINEQTYGKLLNINFTNFGLLKDKNNYRLKKDMHGGILNDIGCYAVHLFLNLTNFDYVKSSSFFSKKDNEEVYTSGVLTIIASNNFYLIGQFSYNLSGMNNLTLNFEKANVILNNCLTTSSKNSIEIKELNKKKLFRLKINNLFFNKIINRINSLFIKSHKEKKVVIVSENPYKNMFNYYFDIISQNQNTEKNNSKILEQAKIMENIRRSI